VRKYPLASDQIRQFKPRVPSDAAATLAGTERVAACFTGFRAETVEQLLLRKTVAPLPCLHSNNSTDEGEKHWESDEWNVLKGNHKKTAKVLELNVRKMVGMFGIEKVGMLTLTFPDRVKCAREAQRRLNSLLSHFIRPTFGEYIAVLERHKDEAIHFHLLIPVVDDIRTGYDSAAIERKDYASASPYLRSVWKLLREELPKYSFGRASLEPIKSSADAVAFYVSKYISKHIGERIESDKGVRLMRASDGVKAGTTRFGWHTDKARLWRTKAAMLGEAMNCTEAQMPEVLRPGWAYRNQTLIQSIAVEDYWSDEAREMDTIPDGLLLVKNMTRHIRETGGAIRISAAECLTLIGIRETSGRSVAPLQWEATIPENCPGLTTFSG